MYLPEEQTLVTLRNQQPCYQGELLVSRLARLQTLLVESACSADSNSDLMQVELDFKLAEDGRLYCLGHLQAQLMLQCQKCLQPFPYEFNRDFSATIVGSESEAKQLPPEQEPWLAVGLASDLKVQILEFIEDEILLSLPMLPKHEEGDVSCLFSKTHQQEETAKKLNPFAKLKELTL